jgi:hypothetical protein
VGLDTRVDAENGDVSMGFDNTALVARKWEPKMRNVKNRLLHSMDVPEAELPDFVRHLRRAGIFQFEFTPKGGKPQRSKFKLLNINTLLDQEQNCKAGLAHLQ